MLYTPLTHPTILKVLAMAGHGSKVLIADGNYPLATHTYADATGLSECMSRAGLGDGHVGSHLKNCAYRSCSCNATR